MDNQDDLSIKAFSGFGYQDISRLADSFKSMGYQLKSASKKIDRWQMSEKAFHMIMFLSKHRRRPIERIKNKNRQKPKK